MQRITELDGVRSFAILAVIGCHYYPVNTMLGRWPQFGWLGVELFFVLSGFLITSILLKLKGTEYAYRVFYGRRILRIFPPYFAVLGLVTLTAFAANESLGVPRLLSKLLFLQSFSRSSEVFETMFHNVRLFVHGYADLTSPLKFSAIPETFKAFEAKNFLDTLGPTWSLSIEEWFYLLWAPVVLSLSRRRMGLICVCVCVSALIVRWLGFVGLGGYFEFFSRIDALMYGALLALYFETRPRLPARSQSRCDKALVLSAALAIVGLGVIVYLQRPVAGREIRESMPFMVFGLPLAGMAFAGFISMLIRKAGSSSNLCRFFRLKALVTLGTISYTLYLVHVPIYFLIMNLAAYKALPPAYTYFGALAVALASLALSIMVAALSFRFFESPILSYRYKLSQRLTGKLELEVASKKASSASAGAL